MKSAGIVCAAIAAAVLAGSMFGYGSYKSMYNSSHNRKEIHKSLDWYNNNIGELIHYMKSGTMQAFQN